MKTCLGALVAWLLFVTVTITALPGFGQTSDEPPLPTWDRDFIQEPQNVPGSHFSNLLPEGAEGNVSTGFFLDSPRMLESPRLLQDEAELSPHDLSLFLRGGLLGVPSEPQDARPTPSLALREAPELVLHSLKDSPRNEYLIDPQSLMTEMPKLDLERLLEFHASEARILFYLLVLDRDQKISSTEELNDLVGRLKGDREICLAVYPLGEPWRTRFLVTQAVNRNSSIQGLTDMAEDCIKDALLTNDAETQLQRFAVKLSTRLFWLEKGLPEAIPANQEGAILHEVARKPMNTQVDQTQSVKSWLQVAGISVVSLLVGVGLRSLWRGWWRSRLLRRQRSVWLLPEVEIQPRLGGAFSGGAGAMMQYGSRIHPQRK